MTTIAFLNNVAGVGTTSLVYHLAWMYADLGVSVVAADLDPQASLTSMFLDEREAMDLWSPCPPRETIHGSLLPLLEGAGDISAPRMLTPRPGLCVVPGDLSLSAAEEELAIQWSHSMGGNACALQVISALGRTLQQARDKAEAELVLIDAGPNLCAVNRAALIAADFVVVPLAADRFPLQGLRNLGPALAAWRQGWQRRVARAGLSDELQALQLPAGPMTPAGYVVRRHVLRIDRPLNTYEQRIDAIPNEYRTSVLEEAGVDDMRVDGDKHCLGTLKSYWGLMPYAQDARKPMFFLEAADGAIGGHMNAVRDCYADYRRLARTIGDRVGVRYPQAD